MPDLGPAFADERLSETLRSFVGAGADSGQPPVVRFLRSVQSVVRKRMEVDSDGDLPAVFLLNESRVIPDGAVRMKMVDVGNKRLEGRIFYAGPRLGYARVLEHGCEHDDVALFDKVVEELDEGSTPAIVFLPRDDRKSVRFYPNGLAEEDEYEVRSVEALPVSLDEILATLDRLHEKQLITPNAQSMGNKMWENAAAFYPVSNAEAVAQSYVETALWARFTHCKIDVEYSQVSGRLDVAVLGYDTSGGAPLTHCHAVLELKILKSFSANGGPVANAVNEEWVRKGMEQAVAYADELNAAAKAVCCFDMRNADSGDQCFAHIADEAVALGVVLKRWYLYGRLSDYRAAVKARLLAASVGQDDK